MQKGSGGRVKRKGTERKWWEGEKVQEGSGGKVKRHRKEDEGRRKCTGRKRKQKRRKVRNLSPRPVN
jgi:hypothetical protein